ncbi:MAG TPA: peptidylprolyl isomerase [Usitatibacter sp.]|jgi:parvulin-like peptidyl-prolyl isomerase|nr:peptidylprolyl isomerase [Usitatibacter sp.]
MRFRFLLAAAALVAGHALAADPPAAAPKKPLPPDAPLVTDGSVVVDRADFDGAMLRIPEQYRAEVRMGYDRIATLVDGVFVTRELALRARAAGLDKDPAVQKRLQQVQEAFLADLYREKLEKETATGNLDNRAHELYLADQSKYVAPEQVHIQQILVSLKGRTLEQARERAQKAYEEAKSGKEDFLAYASLYSDEEKPRGSVPVGDSGWGALQQLVPPVRDAVAKLSKGEISAPIQSEYGFHVVKLVDRKPARRLTFDEVKAQIVAQERERLRKERLDALIREIRSSPTATVHKENVDALVVPLDPNLMKRAQEAKPR